METRTVRDVVRDHLTIARRIFRTSPACLPNFSCPKCASIGKDWDLLVRSLGAKGDRLLKMLDTKHPELPAVFTAYCDASTAEMAAQVSFVEHLVEHMNQVHAEGATKTGLWKELASRFLVDHARQGARVAE